MGLTLQDFGSSAVQNAMVGDSNNTNTQSKIDGGLSSVPLPGLYDTPIQLLQYQPRREPMFPQSTPSEYSQSNKPYEFDTFIKKLAGVESGNNYNAFNKDSKAYGMYQFLPSTQKYIAGQLKMSPSEARTPAGQEKMIRQLTNNNVAGLKKAGIPITNETLWWAHNQGLGGAINLWKGRQVSKRNLLANGGSDASSYKRRWHNIFG